MSTPRPSIDSFESAQTARANTNARDDPLQSNASLNTYATHYTDAPSTQGHDMDGTTAKIPEPRSQSDEIERLAAHDDHVKVPLAHESAVAATALGMANASKTPVMQTSVETEKLAQDKLQPSSSSSGESTQVGSEKVVEEKVPTKNPFKKSKKSKRAKENDKNEVKLEFDPYSQFTPEEKDILISQDIVPEPRRVSLIELFKYQTKLELFLNFLGILCAVVAGVAQPLMTVVFGSLTTSFTQYFAARVNNASPEELAAARDRVLSQTNTNVLYLVYIGVGIMAGTYVYTWTFTVSAERTSRRVRQAYFQSILRQNIAFFDKLGAGEVATRIETDAHLIQDGIGDKIPIAVSFLSMFVAGFVIAYIRNWKLALALSSIVPVIGIAGFFMNWWETKYKTQLLDEVSKGGSLAEEMISSIRTVVAFGNQERLAAKYDISNERAMKYGMKVSLGTGIGLATFFFFIYSSYGLAFQFGTTLFLSGETSSGAIVNCFFAILIGAFSLAQLPPNLQAISLAQSAASKLFDTISRQPVIDSGSDLGDKTPIHGQLAFSDVIFYYPGRPSVKVLDKVSISFNKGETTALVGASGAGKSSVIGIIERFYEILHGSVTVDGKDIKSYNLKHLRRSIGLVSQEPVLFSGTILTNVAHGLIGSEYEKAADDIKEKLVVDACKQANAHNFITALPDGYNTRIGERGALLSGGQRQRISIARAIIKNPAILLLDEATSALDTESEKLVQAAIDAVSKDRTTVIIAHRLSTIRDANKIVVMGQGRILEQGTHHQLLMTEDGPYSRLVNAQKLKEMTTEDALEETEDEKELLKKEAADPEQPIGKLQRTITGLSASSQVLKDKQQVSKQKEASLVQIFRRMAKIVRDQKPTYTIGFIGSAIGGVVYPTAFGILFGYVLQIYSSPDRSYIRSRANFYSLMLFIVGIVATFAISMSSIGFSRGAEVLSRRLRRMALLTFLSQDIAFFDDERNSSGHVTSQISDNAQKLNPLAGATLSVIVQNIVTLIAGIITGLAFFPKLAAVGIACIPLSLSAGITRLYVVILSDKKQKEAHANSAQLACEGAAAIRTVASLTREDDALRLYSKELADAAVFSYRTAFYSNGIYSFSQGLSFWIIGLTFWYGAKLLTSEDIEVRAFFITQIAVIFASIQVGQIFNFVPDVSGSLAAARDLIYLFDLPKSIDPASDQGKKIAVQGHLKLEDVHFRYPTRAHVPVLRGLNIEVKPGQFVALCGPSGCGKSTVISMLERFYDPLTGKVTCDGETLTDLNVSSYRSQIALVAQESQLYDGTMRENILLGSPLDPSQVSDEDLWQACRDANIATFIESLPDGMNTYLGGKGTQLSGGQRSRICLARALLRKPKILLLDEATAALDSESERIVQDALDRAAKGRSTIAVAHRLSTIQNADVIYVLKDGRVAEQGTHSSLLSRKGIYYELVNQQSLTG